MISRFSPVVTGGYGAHSGPAERSLRLADLEARNQQLLRENEDLRVFALGAGHDFKSPLNALEKTLEPLCDGDASPLETARVARDASQLIARMRLLFDDMLVATRISGAAKQAHPEPVSPERCIAEIRSDLSLELTERKADITVGTIPSVLGYPSQIRLLFQNLIENALKFTGENCVPGISIRCVDPAKSGFATIAVTDNGIGILQEHQAQIFEPFNRLHAPSRFAGTGLGLYICRRIAANLGGTITVSSSHEKGTTFLVSLPLAFPDVRVLDG